MKKKAGRPVKWTYRKCLESASQFTTLDAWRSKETSAHNCAYRNGWLSQIIESARLRRKKLPSARFNTVEGCAREAARFDSLTSWHKGHPTSYLAAGSLTARRQIAVALGWKLSASFQTKKEAEKLQEKLNAETPKR